MGAENLGDERSQRELDIVPLNLVEPYETLHNVNCPCSISEGNSHFHENAFFIIGIDQISLSARRCYILNSHFTFSPSPPLFLDQNFSKQAKKNFLPSTMVFFLHSSTIAFALLASLRLFQHVGTIKSCVCVCEKLFHF